MDPWITYAILSMVFAGITAVLAKFGLQGINADLGVAIRTAAVFILITAFSVATDKLRDFSLLTGKQLLLLLLSAVTTSLSWIFYYRALKEGPVSYVAAIDKASILVTILFSFLLLKEPVTPKVLAGAGLIFAGMLVLVWK
jgi:transporter family protein